MSLSVEQDHQECVVSPLLANIYINRLLKAFAGSDLTERSEDRQRRR